MVGSQVDEDDEGGDIGENEHNVPELQNLLQGI
jgi:hypothetical protein